MMRHIFGAFLGLMLLAAPAGASDGKQAAAQAAEAARGLQQYATEAAAAGRRMDLGKGPGADYFRRVFDQASFATLPAPTASDMPWLLDWFGAVRTANHTILSFGADPKQLAALPPEQIARNLAEYEDQFAAATAFLHRMFPRVMATALDFMKTLPESERNAPVRQDGLNKMRAGYVEAVEGSLTFIAAGDVKPDNIRAITAALRDNAGTWSRLVPPADRGRLAKLIATARDRAGDQPSAENLRAVLTTLGK